MPSLDVFDGDNGATLQRLKHDAQTTRTSWHGLAFIVEAMVLLVFLAASIALFMQLFGSSHALGNENADLAHAVVLASNSAEQFAADPVAAADGVSETQVQDGYVVVRTVTTEKEAAGTLYRATIAVYAAGGAGASGGAGAAGAEGGAGAAEGDAIYEISTARYVSEVA